jgi:hypothetical protein
VKVQQMKTGKVVALRATSWGVQLSLFEEQAGYVAGPVSALAVQQAQQLAAALAADAATCRWLPLASGGFQVVPK